MQSPATKTSDIIPKHDRYTRIIFALSLFVYMALIFINRAQGHTAIFAFFPIIAAAACWGWRGGLISALCAFPVNILVLIILGVDWKPGLLSAFGIVGHIFFIFLAKL